MKIAKWIKIDGDLFLVEKMRILLVNKNIVTTILIQMILIAIFYFIENFLKFLEANREKNFQQFSDMILKKLQLFNSMSDIFYTIQINKIISRIVFIIRNIIYYDTSHKKYEEKL